MLIGEGAILSAVVEALEHLSFWVDRGFYNIAKVIYDVFLFIADARILKESTALNLIHRIYAILGIFMLFVLAYNLLMYIIDPDRMTDNEKGMSSIIKNTVIALVVIVLLPTLFNRLYTLQSMVLRSGVIENIVLGGYTVMDPEELEDSGGSAKSGVETGVNIMIANTYAAFLMPNDGNATVVDCMYNNASVPAEYCEAYNNVKETGDINYYSNFIGNSNYRYYPLITTVVAVFLIFFMLSFCLKLGMRAGKLAILQLIAPIPLVLEIVPKKRGTRKKWIDTLVSTYLEVFIYLAMIYLVIFLISLIPDVVMGISSTLTTNNPDAGTVTQLVAIVIFSYGLLQFGKTAPEFVYEILGIKSEGTIKDAAKRALSIGAVGTGLAIGSGGRGIRNTVQTWRTSRSEGHGVIRSGLSGVASGLAGMTSGAARTVVGARNVHSIKDATTLRRNVSQTVNDKRVQRETLRRFSNYGTDPAGILTQHAHNIKTGASKKLFLGSVAKAKYDENAEFINLLDQIASNRTDYVKKDKEYSNFEQIYDTESVKTGYKRFVEVARSSHGDTEEQFVQKLLDGAVTVEYLPGATMEDIKNFKNVASAYKGKEERSKEVLKDKKNDIGAEAWKTAQEIKLDPLIDLQKEGNKEIAEKLDKLIECFKENTEGELKDTVTGETINKAFKELTDELKKTVKTERRKATTPSIEDKISSRRQSKIDASKKD